MAVLFRDFLVIDFRVRLSVEVRFSRVYGNDLVLDVLVAAWIHDVLDDDGADVMV